MIYIGRGWDKVSAAAYGWNSRSITVAFMGNFMDDKPPDKAQILVKDFLQFMVDRGKEIIVIINISDFFVDYNKEEIISQLIINLILLNFKSNTMQLEYCFKRVTYI